MGLSASASRDMLLGTRTHLPEISPISAVPQNVNLLSAASLTRPVSLCAKYIFWSYSSQSGVVTSSSADCQRPRAFS